MYILQNLDHDEQGNGNWRTFVRNHQRVFHGDDRNDLANQLERWLHVLNMSCRYQARKIMRICAVSTPRILPSGEDSSLTIGEVVEFNQYGSK